MSLSDFTHSFSAIKAATHSCHLTSVNNLITFSVNFLLLICIIENLRANIIYTSGHIILVLVICKCTASPLLLLITMNDQACIGGDNILSSNHTIKILSDIPLMALFNIYNLVGTFNCLLNSLLAILSFLFLHCLHLWLWNINLLFEYILLHSILIFIFLCILSVLCTLWDARWRCHGPTRLHTFHEDRIALFSFTAILTLLCLNRLCIGYITLVR